MASDLIIRISATDADKFMNFIETAMENDHGFDGYYLLTKNGIPTHHSDAHLEEENILARSVAAVQRKQNWIVRALYDNDDIVYHGPFHSEAAAQTWMDTQPDDEEMMEMDAFWMNTPQKELE
jgi:hypothetical protein